MGEERGENVPPEIFGGSISVERKGFSTWIREGNIRILEKFGKGERFLSLSLEQARWCLNSSLFLASQPLGSSLEGNSISLVFGRNSFGSFVKIRTQEGVIFVPYGRDGHAWTGFLELISKSLDFSWKLVDRSSIFGGLQNGAVSYSEAVQRTSDKSSMEDLRTGCACKGILRSNSLESRIELLEREVVLLRSFLSTASMLRSMFPSEKTIDSRHLEVIPSAKIVSDSFQNRNGSVQNIGSDDVAVVSDNSPCVTSEIDGFVPEPIPRERLTDYGIFDLIKSSDLSTVPLVHPLTLEELSGVPDLSTAKTISCEVEHADFSPVQAAFDCDAHLTDANMTSEVEANHNSGRYHILQNMKDSEEDSDHNIEEVTYPSEDNDNIYWHDIDETFVHEPSGVRYDPKDNSFFSWLSSAPDDMRVIYYIPMNDTLQLAKEGWKGKANTESLQDQNWDRNIIYSKNAKGFNPRILQLFSSKADESSSSACE